MNATFYSALGEDDKKMLLARAIQLFMPGKPQVWYLDLFAGKNDHAAVARAGEGGHKEINRTNLTAAEIEAGLQKEVVQKQVELLRLRNSCPAFNWNAAVTAEAEGDTLTICWAHGGNEAVLKANLKTFYFTVETK